MRYIILTCCLVYFSISHAVGQMTGTTTVYVDDTKTYTFSNGTIYPYQFWSCTNCAVLSTSISGITYSASVKFTTAGTATIQFLDHEYTLRGSLNVTVNVGVPNTTFSYANNCGSTVITRTTNPPAGVNWYWQTSPTGTSTTNLASSNTVTSAGTYYLRARWGSTGPWSSSSQATAPISISSGPPTPTTGTNGAVIISGQGLVPLSVGSVTGATSYRWYTTSTGGTPVATTPSASFSPTVPSGTTLNYYVESFNGSCPSAGRYQVSATAYAAPIITTSNNATLIFNGNVTLSVSNPSFDTYAWLDGNGIAIPGATSSSFTTYQPGTYKLKVTKGAAPAFITSSVVVVTENYISTNEVLIATTNESAVSTLAIGARIQATQFFDGLGRLKQTVTRQSSPLLRDVVQPVAYDKFGRDVVKYLSYVSTVTDGWLKGGFVKKEESGYPSSPQAQFYQTAVNVAVDSKPYSESVPEASPLNRILKDYGPGYAWSAEGSNKYVEYQYLVNVHNTGASATQEKVVAWSLDATGMPERSAAVANYTLTNGYYANGQLTVKVTRDEQRNAVREYTDKKGKVVLKKVQVVGGSNNLNSTNDWAMTYYVYDDLGNLKFVFPPELSKRTHSTDTYKPSAAELGNWAFQYKYDSRGRMMQKQVPGAGPVYMVYDKRDRLVMTQDANQRAGTTKYWSFTKYDALNRPVLTGITISANTLIQMQTAVDNYYATLTTAKAWFESYIGNGTGNMHGYDNKSYPQETTLNNYLTVTYYDNYNFRSLWTTGGPYTYTNDALSQTVNSVLYNQPMTENLRIIGQVTGTKVKVLDGGVVGGSNYLKSISYYDDKYRVIQVIADNNKGGNDRISNLIDFAGKVLKTKTTHSTNIPTTHSITRSMEYDHAGRLTRTWHQLNTGTNILIAKNDYNELGQLIDKKLHSTVAAATNAKQSVDYLYNIRGWLTKINNSDVSTIASGDAARDYFGMELGYNGSIGTGNTGLFNGNISGMKWSVNQGYGTMKEMGYNYTYDAMNRLMTAVHRQNNGSWAAGQYDESVSLYDLNGNIINLQRKGAGGAQIDNLTYNYGTGAAASNRLLYVQDNTANATDKAKGFVDGNTGTATDYSYDVNGNMNRDLNKGIGNNITDATNIITYNFLNLPETVTKGGNNIRYVYDATGRKLAQIVTTGTIQKRTDYLGEFHYENNTLQFINHEEGRIAVASTKLIITHPGESTTGITAVNTTLATYTNNGEKYIRVTANNTTARSGIFPIGGTINVQPGERYRIRARGYRGTGTNAVYLAIKANSTDLNWPGATLPPSATTESWIEQTVTIPAGATTLQAGVTWNTVTSGAIFYLNEFEITQLTTITPEYQYHLKDHLGNVRVTFTTKDETESATATLETANMNAEQAKFLRYSNARRIQSSLFDRTNGAATGYAQRLNGSANEKYGLARSLSVMPGDKLNIEVYAKYVDTNSANWTAALNTLLTQIAAGTAPAGTVVDGSGYGASTSSFPYPGLVNTSGSTGGPKAYLNYILFDRNFVFKTGGFKRLSATPKETGNNVAHERLFFDNLTITEPGYIYIYLSNEETTPVEVFFDDFKVGHIKSPVIHSDDYYPFGLTYNSCRRENSVENRRLYNAKELQTELAIGWYDYGWRNYDPVIARWNQIDPYVARYEDWSPYNYVQDNPVSRTDPDGRWVNFVVGAIVGAATDYAAQVIVNVAEGKDLGDALTDVDGVSIATSAVMGAVTSGTSALTRTIGVQVEKQVVKTTTQKVVNQTTKVATSTAVKVKKTLEERAQQLNKADRSGKDFTPTGKEVVKQQNAAKNDGQTKCQGCGSNTQPAQKHQKGVTPPQNETHVDHIDPKSKGGSGTPNNGQVLCRKCNLEKGSN